MFQKQRNTAAVQNASDDHSLELTATFWSAVLLHRFYALPTIRAEVKR